MSPRLTLAETCTEFRKAGISITNDTLADDIAAGKYPFGRLVKDSGQRRTFEIWAKDVHAFLESLKQPAQPTLPVPAGNVLPAQIPTKTLQVIKWAQVCSGPNLSENDCLSCPYRTQKICNDALLADAAAVLMDMTLVVSAHS